MRLLDFLAVIWPSQGWFCVAQRKSKGDASWWAHESFDTHEAAAEKMLTIGQLTDVWYAVLSMKDAFLIDENKIEKARQDGRTIYETTGRTYRTHANMAWARTFFADLDVGQGDGKYPTQQVAFEALKQFCKKLGLPKPYVVNSGNGLHIYWPFDGDVHKDEWRPYALKLKALFTHYELKVDPTRVADMASVLRPPGTYHCKDPDNPKRVKVEIEGVTTPFDELCRLIDRAYQLTPTGETYRGDQPAAMAATPVSIENLGKACALAKEMIDAPQDQNEPRWYKLLGLLKFTEGGAQACHDISSVHPSYQPEWIDTKLAQLDRKMPDGTTLGPTTCKNMAETCGPGHCKTCWFSKTAFYKEGSSSPIVAARRLPLDSVEGVPQAPFPYIRTSTGILIEGADAPQVICPFDFYPIAVIEDQHAKTRASRWAIQLPRKELRQVVIQNEVASDATKLGVFLGNNAFLPTYDEAKAIKQYMTHYIRELQKHMDDHQSFPYLGWTDDKSFVMPEGELRAGITRPVLLSKNAQTIGAAIHKSGERAKQMQALRFYSDPAFVGHQFMIGASLASPLLFATGQYGTVVNMTGPTGASKSTALRFAASMWGKPDAFMLSGTAGAQTMNHRNLTIATLKNMPVLVDEITMMLPEDMRNMVMAFTQPTAQKGGLTQQGEVREKISESKSTLMLTTSNNAMHEVLSHRNQAGSAGSMRLFEIVAQEPPLKPGQEEADAKADADDFIDVFTHHYGHVGFEWMSYVTAHHDEVVAGIRAEMRRIDKLVESRGSERFWTAVAAIVIYTMRTCKRLGLLLYDVEAIESWLMHQQFPSMRSIVSTSYDSNIDQFMSYLSASISRMAMVTTSNQTKQRFLDTTLHRHHGELAGVIEPSLNRVIVLASDLKSYASKERLQLHTLTTELIKKGLLTKRRCDPLAGTVLSMGTQACYVVDLTHSLIAAHDKADAVSNVVQMRTAT